MEIEFDFGDMYLNPVYPKYFNFMSTYSFTLYLISFLNAIMLSTGIDSLWCGVLRFTMWTFVVSFLAQAGFVILYLKLKEGKTADQAVHGQKSS